MTYLTDNTDDGALRLKKIEAEQHKQNKIPDKDVQNYCKRYNTCVGTKTTEILIESFFALATKGLVLVVKIEDPDALQNDIKNDYIITKEMSNLAGGLGLR